MPNGNFSYRMDLNSGFRVFATQGSNRRPFSSQKGRSRTEKLYTKNRDPVCWYQKINRPGFFVFRRKGKRALSPGKDGIRMDNTQHTYFAELKLALQKADYSVQPVEDGLLPIEWNDRRLCQVTESGDIRFRTDDTTDPAAEVARGRSQTLPVWSGSI